MCLILLSKIALAMQQINRHGGSDGVATEIGQHVYDWMLQASAGRFSDQELEQLGRRFGLVDEALRGGPPKHETGFLGPTTDYEFEEIPAAMTTETVCAAILDHQQRVGDSSAAVP